MSAASEGGVSTAGPSGSGIGGDELFVRHQITKFDSLAGLAVKYNVTVSDIKRANSLLSDTAMFARDTLLIPTRPMPVGQEYSAWAGMIVTQYGQISRDHPRGAGPLDSSGGRPSHAAIEQMRAHYGLTPHGSPVKGPRMGSGDYAHSDDGLGGPRGEVEMQDLGPGRPLPRRPSLPELTSHAGEKGGPAYDDRLRRRRANEGEDLGHVNSMAGPSGHTHSVSADATSGASFAADLYSTNRPPLLPSASAPCNARSRGGMQGSGGPGPPPGRRRESFFEKVKRAASQPALAGPAGPSLVSVAESAIASAKPKAAVSSTLQQAAAALQGPKDSAKKE